MNFLSFRLSKSDGGDLGGALQAVPRRIYGAITYVHDFILHSVHENGFAYLAREYGANGVFGRMPV